MFVQSAIKTPGIQLTPLFEGDSHDGSNAFTYARFSVPERMGFAGSALFVDAADMLLRGELEDLWALRDKRFAVQVVKHDYLTKHPSKYVGTALESQNRDYPRKNWSSVVIWNCAHMAHFRNRDKLRSKDGSYLHRFGWLNDNEIGELPIEWNWLADEYGPNPKAKLLHWTCGQPGFSHYSNAPHADEWKATMLDCMAGMQYQITLSK